MQTPGTLKPWWWKKRRVVVVLVAAVFLVYVLSYLVLSREGYAEADRFGLKGFYYFTPEDSDSWRRKNYGCMYLYMPLNLIDRAAADGRTPASEPLWGLR